MALLEPGWIFKVLLIRNFEWKAKGANTHVFIPVCYIVFVGVGFVFTKSPQSVELQKFFLKVDLKYKPIP